jgi:hypothetical protein
MNIPAVMNERVTPQRVKIRPPLTVGTRTLKLDLGDRVQDPSQPSELVSVQEKAKQSS